MSNVCPDCDANNLLDASRCWLCEAVLKPEIVPEEAVTHVEVQRLVKRRKRQETRTREDVFGKSLQPKGDSQSKHREDSFETYYIISSLLIAATIFGIAFGLKKEAPGIAAILGFVASPAVLWAMGIGLYRHGRGEKFSVRKTILDFAISATVIGSVLFVILGTIVFCFYLLLKMICTGKIF